MLTSLIAGFIGATIGISFWIVPDMFKHWKQRKSIKKLQEKRLFELEVEAIVINKLQELYNEQSKKGENGNSHQE